MSIPSLASLLVQETAKTIYAKFISIAQTVGLNTEAWAVGDPTRSEFSVLASYLETIEPGIVQALKGAFLGLATGDWLTIKTAYDFNTNRRDGSFATCTVRLTNSKGGVFDFDPGAITVRNSSTQQTYRSTTGGHLGSTPAYLDIDVEAEVAGSAGSAGAGSIDQMVTTFSGVTCASITDAIGEDEELDDPLRARASMKFESLSPAGPKGAFEYIAKTPELNGGANVTRARSYGLSVNGVFPVYLASPSGGADPASVALVQAACLAGCTAIAQTPQFFAAINKALTLSYVLRIYSTVNLQNAQIEARAKAALDSLIGSLDIGGDIVVDGEDGIVSLSVIEQYILDQFVVRDSDGNVTTRYGISCDVTVVEGDGGDPTLAPSEVAVLSAPATATITQVVKQR